MNHTVPKRIDKKLYIMVLLAVLYLYPARAQFYNGSSLTFGKNRVQYNDFQWSYFQFEDFDTYFYLNGKELALYTATYAQDQIKETEKKLETTLDDKIQFVVFNTLTDLKQSNLGLINEDNNYNTGGITRILDQKVILYFNGNHNDFRRQIREGITLVILNQMLYGSSITSQVKNATLLFLPDWYLSGLLSYLTEEWNTDIDNRVRDGILTGRYQKFNQLTGEDAAYAGHSIWKFVAEKYGSTVVSNIIYMAKISKNVESGFMFVLGISFKTITREWINFYQARYQAETRTDSLPDKSNSIVKPKQHLVYNRLKISPDGLYAAYSSNEAGLYRVYLKNLETGKTRKIFKRGFRLDNETDYTYPLLAWHPSSKLLAMITEEKGRTNLYFYTLSSGRFDKRFLFSFDKVLDFSYSPDGKNFVVSAVIKGQSDIFVYNIASNTYDQVTKDLYDDLEPRFIDNGKKIIFSSNRTNDTLKPSQGTGFYTNMPEKHDLYVYEYNKRRNVLKRITNSPLADERQAVEYENGFISYLSDENGIFNRYIARFDSAIAYIDTTTHYRYFTVTYPVTNYIRNIQEQDISPKSGKYGEILFFGNKYHLFVGNTIPAQKMAKRTLVSTAYMNQLSRENTQQQQDSIKQLKKQYQSRKKRFLNVKSDELDFPDSTVLVEDNKIDINNYVFDKQAFIKLSVKDTSLTSQSLVVVGNSKIATGMQAPKQLNYLVVYSINQLVSQVDFTYLNSTYQPFTGGGTPIFLNPGFNALLKVGVSDLMENYRITGGVRLQLSLTNNEYLLSFTNLKNRLDKEITFHRQVVENTLEDPFYAIVRHYSHEAYYTFTWPFNEVLSIRGTGSVRNDRAVYLSIDELNLREPGVTKNWSGLKGELVYDNTRNLGLNLMQGMRYKLFGEYYQQVDQGGKGLAVLGFDIRNYQRVHRTLIWANRFAASTSFGGNQLIYYMGGVDNWLAPRFNQDVPIATEQPYAYQTLATNMRGFTQNIRNGNSFAVINSEIRMPVFRYFVNRPIKSDFINNFQVIAFGDIGTAWNGPSPYSRKNSLYRRKIPWGPVGSLNLITIENQVEPVVGGYGFGLRTRFLGYFLRADWAWGVEDYEVQKGIFYISLSLDF
ncbi:MAG: hypothetical protein AB9842_14545 [Bacteroidales bacterium]